MAPVVGGSLLLWSSRVLGRWPFGAVWNVEAPWRFGAAWRVELPALVCAAAAPRFAGVIRQASNLFCFGGCPIPQCDRHTALHPCICLP